MILIHLEQLNSYEHSIQSKWPDTLFLSSYICSLWRKSASSIVHFNISSQEFSCGHFDQMLYIPTFTDNFSRKVELFLLECLSQIKNLVNFFYIDMKWVHGNFRVFLVMTHLILSTPNLMVSRVGHGKRHHLRIKRDFHFKWTLYQKISHEKY